MFSYLSIFIFSNFNHANQTINTTALYPILFAILPNLIIISILLSTYPSDSDTDLSQDDQSLDPNAQHDPLPANEPSESSVECVDLFLASLEVVKILMRWILSQLPL